MFSPSLPNPQRSADDFHNLQMALNAHALVSITDPTGKITYVNEQFCAVSQYSREELLGADHRIINSHHHPPEFFRQLWATISAGQTWQGEICNRAKDGSLYWVSSTIVPFLDAEGRIYQFVAIRTDISLQKRLAAEVESTLRVKSQFLATMSHEIGTPMHGVIGLAALLKKTRLDLQQQEYVESMISCGQTLIFLVNDILDVAKIEAGKMQLEVAPFSLPALLDECLTIFVDSAEAKGLPLNYHIPTGMPMQLIGDPARLTQILTNLISNAIKFTQCGRVDIRLGFSDISASRVRFRLAVDDTGMGMSEEQLRKVGKAFVKADSSTTRQFGGTGLGLYICKSLIELMHGRFEVRSEQGKGSSFSVEMDMQIGQPDPQDVYPRLAGKIIFAAVSEPSLILRLEKLCTRWSMRLSIFPQAASLVQGLSRAEQAPDVIFIDEDLPGINGLMLVKMLRREARWGKTPLIFTSPDPEFVRHKFAQISVTLLPGRPLRAGNLLLAFKQIFLAATPEAPPLTPSRRRLSRILVAEDNPVNQMLIQEFLRDYADVIELASNGREAVELYQKQKYDCIFMDCQMPDMDGYEATRFIRSVEQQHKIPPLPIIALTANAMPGDRDICLAAGMSDYLGKPLTENELKSLFERLFELKPALESKEDPGALLKPAELQAVLRQALLTFQAEESKSQIAWAQSDFTALGNSSHKLKSTAAWLQLNELSRLAKELEVASRKSERTSVEKLFPLWIEALRAGIEELRMRLV